jgi:hypothetical protein
MSIAGNNSSDKISQLWELATELGEFVERAAIAGQTLYDVERGVFDRLLKMGRTVVDRFVVMQGDGDLGEIASADDGRPIYRSVEPISRQLRTIFGQHQFRAYVYRERAHPNTAIVFRPIDARMSLSPSSYSPLLEEFTQLFCIEHAFDPAAEAFQRIFRQKLSVDTLERVNQRMGEEAAEFLVNLDIPPVAEEGELLVLTSDAKGVPLVKADALRLACFEERPQRPGNRRMATLASVYSVDRFVRTGEHILAALFRDGREESTPDEPRPEPCHKRIIARFPRLLDDIDATTPVSGSLLALSWAGDQVEQRRQPKQTLICLMDGQSSLWETARLCTETVPADKRIEILDIVHVSSYVWKAAKALHNGRADQEAFTRERLRRILEGDVKGVIMGLRQMATRHLGEAGQKEIETVCGYFTTHADRMHYDRYLAAGCPIATGVIEGACRHLVKDRMERSGMRWTQSGAQAMLDVRSVHQSAYWNEFHRSRIIKQNETIKPYRQLLDQIEILAA